jgi:DNA repair protein RadC
MPPVLLHSPRSMTNYSPTPELSFRIQDLAPGDQPRERLQRFGARHLSDSELLAVLLGSGIPGMSVLEVSRQLLSVAGRDLHQLARYSLNDFQRQPGIGKVGAMRLIAAFELARRRDAGEIRKKAKVTNSEDAYNFLRPLLADLNHEEFHVLCLNRANKVLGAHLISRGGTTGPVADAKTIFRTALGHGSITSLVLAHNHPSGQAFPSEADVRLTRKLCMAAQSLDLHILDHIIVAGSEYYSFADNDGLPG